MVPELVTQGPPILVAVGFALLLFVMAGALGRRILSVLGSAGAGATPAERGVLAVALGVGTLQFVPLLLGAVGLLSVLACRVALGVLVVLLGRDMLDLVRRTWAALRSEAANGVLRERWVRVWLVVLAPAVLVALAKALTPTLDADGLAYHLTAPKRWLESGWLHYLPTYVPTHTPMGADMLFVLGLSVAGDTATKVTHFGLGVFAALATYQVGARLSGPVVGAAAATLLLVGPSHLTTLLGNAYTEGAICLALVASLLACVLWLKEPHAAWLKTAGLLVGIAVSFKLTAVLFAVALVGVVALAILLGSHASEPLGDRLSRSVATCLKLSLFVAIPVVPWLLRAAILTGNPIFPLAAGLIPTRDFAASLGESYSHYNRYLSWGTSMGASLTIDQRRMLLMGVAAGMTVLAAVVWFMLNRAERVARAATLVVLSVALLQVATIGLYARYWVPYLAIAQVLVVAAFAKFLRGGWQRSVIVAATGLCSLYYARANSSELGNDWGGIVRSALDLEPRRDFIVRHYPLYPIYEYVNDKLPKDARVLSAYHCSSFYMDRDTYCTDFAQSALRFDSWADFTADAQRLGVTHVIAPRSVALGGAPPDVIIPQQKRQEQYQFLNRLLSQHGALLASAADQGLYAVDLQAASRK